jgi:hypothetical protein
MTSLTGDGHCPTWLMNFDRANLDGGLYLVEVTFPLLSKSEPCNYELWAAPAITADLGQRHRRWRSQSSLYEQIDLPDGLRRMVCLDKQSQELHAADNGDARMTKIVVPFDGNCMWWVSERFQVAAQQVACEGTSHLSMNKLAKSSKQCRW